IARRPQKTYTGELMRTALSFTRSASAPPAVQKPGRETTKEGLLLRSIHRSFPARGGGRVQALSGVTLKIGSGEIVGLIGESGSGKTTLGRITVGLEKAESGEVILDGSPFDPRGQRATVQMVFQDPLASFNPRRAIKEALVHPLRRHLGLTGRSARARIEELLDEVGLDPALGSRQPNQLSGGQLQRAAIARALAARPRFVVCDEAVASLDVSVRAQILELLERLRADEGLGILMISHDLGVVKSIADRTVVLFNGREVESGPTGQVLKSPREGYTRKLIAAVPSGLVPWRERLQDEAVG
ncbi:MAG: ATP-binding cassette domain-containing protein, partial [Albidovulum sp.]|nr:ATP-binding cassette domain-containing protein [Albidovulum sp.]